jgi:hypothetical protein
MALEILLLCFLICPVACIFALWTALDRGEPPSLKRQGPVARRRSQPSRLGPTPVSPAPIF